jgi:hypothetical protein
MQIQYKHIIKKITLFHLICNTDMLWKNHEQNKFLEIFHPNQDIQNPQLILVHLLH